MTIRIRLFDGRATICEGRVVYRGEWSQLEGGFGRGGLGYLQNDALGVAADPHFYRSGTVVDGLFRVVVLVQDLSHTGEAAIALTTARV